MEPDENDASILQSLMKQGIEDRRTSMYPALPPQMARGAEDQIANLPPHEIPAPIQEALMIGDRMDQRQQMEQPERVRAGTGPAQPVSRDLTNAMMLALRPDLAKLQRPPTLQAVLRRSNNANRGLSDFLEELDRHQ